MKLTVFVFQTGPNGGTLLVMYWLFSEFTVQFSNML